MSPRRDVSMTAEEVAAFLTTASEAVVGIVGDDGYPTATRVACESDDGEVRLLLGSNDPLLEAIVDGAPLCAAVEHFPSYYEIQGVTVHGVARAVEPTDDGTRVVLDLDDVVSFDFGKLREGRDEGGA